jgi:hypothetical protein
VQGADVGHQQGTTPTPFFFSLLLVLVFPLLLTLFLQQHSHGKQGTHAIRFSLFFG